MRTNASAPNPGLLGTRTSLLYPAILRILMGLIFLLTAFENLGKGLYGPSFRGFLQGWARGNPIDWYRQFLEGVIIPNWELMAVIQAVAEFGMGIALIVGVLTPLAALGGAFFMVNLLLASWGKEWPWIYVNMIVMLLVVAASGSGRALGLDYFLERRLPPILGPLVRGLARRRDSGGSG